MNVQVEVAGVRREISVRRSGRGWLVHLDGRPLYADLVAANGRWSLLLAEGDAAGPADAGPHESGEAGAEGSSDDRPAEVGDGVGSGLSRTSPGARPGFTQAFTSYEIAADAGAINVNGHAVPVLLDDPRAPRVRRGRQLGSAATGSGRVTAPMPGRIVKVLVAAGDAVSAGQALLVMEAMKMENEIRASRSGTVADVRVAEGASVDAHTVLMHLE